MTGEALDALWLSLRVAAVALAWALPAAFALGYVLARYRFLGHGLLSALTMMPLVMPPVATGLVLLWVFGPAAPAGQFFAAIGMPLAFRWTGAALAAGLVALPLIVRPIRLGLEAIDPRLDEALAVAGHSPVRRFFALHLPLAVPGIVAGAVLGFAKALGEFGATITFVANIPGETRTLSLAMHTALQRIDGGGLVLVLAGISLAVSLVAVMASEALLGWLTPRLTGRTEPLRA